MINAVYDLTGCTRADLKPTDLITAMRTAVSRLGCTILGELPVAFQPHGTTCVLVLAESHLTVATWPEHQLAHIDLFTCRADTEPGQAIRPIANALGAKQVQGQLIRRLDPSFAGAAHRTSPDTSRGRADRPAGPG